MINKKITTNYRDQKIRLPFEKRPTDAGMWSYQHRFGLCVTVIIFLLAGIVFMTVKIKVNTVKIIGYVLTIQDDPIEVEEEPEPLEKRVQELTAEDFRSVQNAISNEQAQESEQVDQEQSDFSDQILDQARKVVDGTSSNRDLYEQGLRDEQAIINSKRDGEKKEKKDDVKVKGGVTVSYSFVNPVRQSVDYDVPAYMCEGGGAVVVIATVNRNGDVIAATVDKNRSTSDKCIISTALRAAKQFKFNVNADAPERQQGTISYIFIPQ